MLIVFVQTSHHSSVQHTINILVGRIEKIRREIAMTDILVYVNVCLPNEAISVYVYSTYLCKINRRESLATRSSMCVLSIAHSTQLILYVCVYVCMLVCEI